jgi:hypothetical protein
MIVPHRKEKFTAKLKKIRFMNFFDFVIKNSASHNPWEQTLPHPAFLPMRAVFASPLIAAPAGG